MFTGISYRIRPEVEAAALSDLFASAWQDDSHSGYGGQLDHSLTFVCAYAGERLVGFVNVAWDGGAHAFVLDTSVDVGYQRHGIGKGLVLAATNEAARAGCEWLHVDYEVELASFYKACGFVPTTAGLMQLTTQS